MTMDAAIGAHNDITDVGGVRVGHHQRIGRGWMTGVTVVVPPPGTVGGVDVRGGGPGTRETDLLEPGTLVERVDAVCLTGGSAYGLASASGVADWLGEHGIGYPVGPEPAHVVPIVPAAVIFDFGGGGRFAHRPDATFGRTAVASASARPVRQGCVGAGTGAHAGNLKGGIGSASVVLGDGSTVAALVVVNSSGSPVDPATGELYGARFGIGNEFKRRRPSRAELAAYLARPLELQPLNTTLAVVATDARLAKQECRRLAIAGHDGMARAIRPIHQLNDGDVVFGLATGGHELVATEGPTLSRLATGRPALVNPLLAAAADVVARAIVHAVLAARTLGPLPSYSAQFPSFSP